MRGILGVVLSACLLLGCGGVETDVGGGATVQQEAAAMSQSVFSDDSAQTPSAAPGASCCPSSNCRVECWDGPNAGTTQQNFATRLECERFAMSYCNADLYAGGYWWRGEFWAW